jgi:hypothetical protein
VRPPEDWSALAPPEVSQPVGATVGKGVRLLGFTAPRLEAFPGETLPLDLYWQALQDHPQPGATVLQLADDAGTVLAEASAPLAGAVPHLPIGGQPGGVTHARWRYPPISARVPPCWSAAGPMVPGCRQRGPFHWAKPFPRRPRAGPPDRPDAPVVNTLGSPVWVPSACRL